MLEEVVVPCLGRKLEAEVLPALEAALFARDLEPLAALVRAAAEGAPWARAAIEKDWQELRNDILHGQIDYRGKGPLPEHWKQHIDKQAALFDWRHPKWAQDAERLLVDLVVKAADLEGWQGEVRPHGKTGAGLVELVMELQAADARAAPLAAKFLEGMPEWMQHDNAYTGGYLTEEDVGAMLEVVGPRAQELEGALKAGALVPGWVEVLKQAAERGVGLTWTVPMLRA